MIETTARKERRHKVASRRVFKLCLKCVEEERKLCLHDLTPGEKACGFRYLTAKEQEEADQDERWRQQLEAKMLPVLAEEEMMAKLAALVKG